MDGQTKNAIELRQSDALNWIEFETVCLSEWEELGFGELGDPVKIAGMLMTVENGHTMSRAYTRVWVRVTAPTTGKTVEIISTLGSHRTVTLTDVCS
ncbi:hypothetical protein H9Y04_36355 [Streptomyces sp. TRM66268-LWL]|uniref:Uncharacterized protein n=1 Tax=Streptomyces polyasparticus TaxID=2767826 RepID=A0ABR7SR84_9ACTN|nr:hypothetical protein [Streptomyces polyasparticus]MBC9718020.1 hypothetical protein [Streptomyces polyasparticus]